MPKRRKPMIGRLENISPEKLLKRGHMCAWDDCTARFDGLMPADWRWMIVYWSPQPAVESTVAEVVFFDSCDHDAALCPEHARCLEDQLKPLMRLANIKSAGQA
jgi:hypothetical protein